MKIEITIYKNKPDVVKVKNIGNRIYNNRTVPLKPGEEKEIPVGLAKMLFGDWEDKSYGEERRKARLNIHLIDIKIRTEIAQISLGDVKVDQTPEAPKTETEFRLLEELNPPEIIFYATVKKEDLPKEESILIEKKLPQCKGLTKAGKQCRREALPGEECCASHK